MATTRRRVCGALACVAVSALACGVLSPEEQLLTDFFEASRVYDTSAMARLSAKPLNPRTDGIVDGFEIERVERSERGREQLTVAVRVRRFGGGPISPRRLVFTLTNQNGRWFIQDFR